MTCKDCTGGGGFSTRVSDVRSLYNPSYGTAGSIGKPSCRRVRCAETRSRCKQVCQLPPCCADQFKAYWFRNCEVPIIRRYEEQPWFRNRVVQDEWRDFVDQLVTPYNIGCKLCPGPDDWQFKCHKARSLIGPNVECTWDLPEQEPCATTRYGYNRDWRRYNEDQRLAASDVQCGCNDEPKCKPIASPCEYPPYLGQKYGARYMAWSQPTGFMFPRRRPMNYQSLPKC
ncbi:unnamed protein product [Orchesella dallaii]|uniref:Uncharacterized protein n=1 Tax=Orchesella dallaii TaxID=48710 RepID=A0ABP1QI91_9HEXA